MGWTQVPAASRLADRVPGAHFADSYEIPLRHAGRTAPQLAAALMRQTPSWFEALMAARNRVASRLGLKHLGRFGAVPPGPVAPGERFGIFTLVSQTDDEIIVQDVDRHLTVQLSVFRALAPTPTVCVTTVVHVHNALGRAYMAVVGPAHRLLTPLLLRRMRL